MARRKSQERKLQRLIVIFTEGETEKIYFEQLNQKYRRKIRVQVTNHGKQGLNAIEEAQKLLNNPKEPKFKGKEIDQVYILFDKDQISLQELRSSKKKADCLGYKIGFTNEAIELWILLHLRSVNEKYDRKELKREISKQINKDYDKTDEHFFSSIIDNYIHIALENADEFSKEIEFDKNPYTNIGWIIKEIYEL